MAIMLEELCPKPSKSTVALCLALKKSVVREKVARKLTTMNKETIKKSVELLRNEARAEKVNKAPFGSFQKVNWRFSDNNESVKSTIFSPDFKSVCFNPGYFETNAVRADLPLKFDAFTYWEVSFKSCSGTSLMLGIGTKESRLETDGYLNLLGLDETSYGLNQHGVKWHDNSASRFCDGFEENQLATVGCLFDGFKGRLIFYKNGKCLGAAFENIKLARSGDGFTQFYPMLASTVAQSVFQLEFACENFPSLQDLCRQKIQAFAKNDAFRQQLNETNLAKPLRQYLNL